MREARGNSEGYKGRANLEAMDKHNKESLLHGKTLDRCRRGIFVVEKKKRQSAGGETRVTSVGHVTCQYIDRAINMENGHRSIG
jgi:hypothetical protein